MPTGLYWTPVVVLFGVVFAVVALLTIIIRSVTSRRRLRGGQPIRRSTAEPENAPSLSSNRFPIPNVPALGFDSRHLTRDFSSLADRPVSDFFFVIPVMLKRRDAQGIAE